MYQTAEIVLSYLQVYDKTAKYEIIYNEIYKDEDDIICWPREYCITKNGEKIYEYHTHLKILYYLKNISKAVNNMLKLIYIQTNKKKINYRENYKYLFYDGINRYKNICYEIISKKNERINIKMGNTVCIIKYTYFNKRKYKERYYISSNGQYLKYTKNLIFISNKYELLYYSNYFLIMH